MTSIVRRIPAGVNSGNSDDDLLALNPELEALATIGRVALHKVDELHDPKLRLAWGKVARACRSGILSFGRTRVEKAILEVMAFSDPRKSR